VVAAVAAIACLTLLLAAVNYINLATARSGLRAREVALRKVMGATRWTLIAQFLAESTATAALGVLLGLAICELALPSIDAAIGLKLQIDYLNDPVLDALLVLTVLFMGVVAGLYPASVLARFQPAAVLASAKAPGGGRAGSRVREALVAFQFAIAVAFSIGAAVIVSQTLYVRKADLGFRREGLIIVTSSNASGLGGDAVHRALLASWRATPGVLSAGEVSSTPGSMMAGFGKLKRAGATGDGLPISINRMGPDAFETLGARLIAGRLPDRAHGEDFPVISPPNPPTGSPEPPWPKVLNSVLNARAVRALGFRDARDAVGADLVFSGGAPMTLHVIGVVQDIKLDSPREVLPPSLYFGERGPIAFSRVVVRYAAADPRPIIDRIAADWRRIVPTAQPFEAKTMDQALAPYYHTDDQIGGMLGAAAVLAVLIGCVGLYGLASFNTARRVKEIGIRKTLGASTGDILKLLVGQFLRPVVIANLFAWPLAWWAMTSYLSGFDQRITLTPVYFLAATALTLLIAVGTVAGQAYAVARAEPAKALRHE
jgi:putative ABC transport system permease protein